MPIRLTRKITLLTAAVSVCLLVVGVSGAWYVYRLQQLNSQVLDFNVASIRASERLEILVRQIRHELDRFLLTQNSRYLTQALETEADVRHWLAESQRLCVSPEETALAANLHRGMDTFFTQLRAVLSSTEGNAVMQRVERLGVEVLDENALPRAHEYLKWNERELQKSNEQNKAIAERLALALLLVGTCGAVAGLVAGYGAARGVSRAVYQLSVPIRNVAGKLAEVVGPVMVSGNPSVKDLETVLKRLAAQVGSVVEELHARHREVMRADQLAAVGQLAAGLAHELRNPLMSMKILVQSARRDGDAGALTAQDLVVLDEEITRLENLLQAFLDFARPAKLEKKEIDAGSVIRRTVDFLSGRAAQRNVEIDCRLPAEPLLVQADEAQFRQVLLNLLLNALDAVRNGGRVWVEAQREAGGPDDGCATGAARRALRVRIADNGRGLPPNDRNRIYEPFFSTKETGLGLGLAVCQHFVRAHGGELRESDRPGGGAVFELRLPATQAPARDGSA